MRARQRYSWFVLSISILLGVPGCTPTKAVVEKKERKRGKPVEVVVAEQGNLTEVSEYSGKIEARSRLRVSAEIPGRVQSVLVEEGTLVKPGAPLLTIEDDRYRLAKDQAEQNLAAARVRVQQLEASLGMEQDQLTAAKAQAEAAVAGAQARVRLVETGARSEEKRQSRARLAAAEVARKNAATELARTKELVAGKVAPRQQLDSAKAAFDSSEAQYEVARQAHRIVVSGAREEDRAAAKASLAQTEAALAQAVAGLQQLDVRKKDLENARIQVELAGIALANAEYELGKISLSNPLSADAVVVTRLVEPGEVVAPGAPLLELMDLSRPRVRVAIPGKDVGLLKVGGEVAVRCLGDEVDERMGRISMVGVEADPVNTTYPVFIDLENEDRGLRSGQLCTAIVPLETHRMILVPSDIVMDTESGKMVVVYENDRARFRGVKLAAVQGGVAAIIEGLQAGERVVTTGARLVKDGDLLRLKEPAVGPGDDGGES